MFPRCTWVLPLLLAALPARAAIYTYVDRQGVIHFTNTPQHPGAREYHPGDDLGFGGAADKVRFANTPRMWAPATIKAGRTSRYDDVITRAAHRYRLPPALVKAITAAESGFNPDARSHAGACGLMQLMPATAAEMDVRDVFDPAQNVMGGARYLRYLINHFDGDVKLAVAAYNAGPNLVARVRRVPNIPETRVYVRRVLGLYRGYRKEELLAER
ncbi:MAG: lytic transglycosylase domain-containing protein [Deltaproteobacteria bacterium]|nr:lytic transglycosylase domain-containing protein [Deltaproteobacteria bacterium]